MKGDEDEYEGKHNNIKNLKLNRFFGRLDGRWKGVTRCR